MHNTRENITYVPTSSKLQFKKEIEDKETMKSNPNLENESKPLYLQIYPRAPRKLNKHTRYAYTDMIAYIHDKDRQLNSKIMMLREIVQQNRQAKEYQPKEPNS